VILLTLALVGPTWSPAAHADAIDEAEQHLEEGSLGSAQTGFEALAKDDGADAVTRGRAAMGLAHVARQNLNYDQADQAFGSAIEHFGSDAGNKAWLGVAHFEHGRLKLIQADKTSARQAFQAAAKAFAGAQPVDDRQGLALRRWQADALTQAAAILDDHKTAIAELENAIGVMDNVEDKGRLADMHFDLAMRQWHQGQRDGAFNTLKKSVEFFRSIDDKAGEASANIGMAQIKLEQGDAALAETRFNDARLLVPEEGSEREHLVIAYGLGQAQRSQGKYEDAQASLEQAQRWANRLQYTTWQERIGLAVPETKAPQPDKREGVIDERKTACAKLKEEAMQLSANSFL